MREILLKIYLRVIEIRSILRKNFIFHTREEVKTNPLIGSKILFTRIHLAEKDRIRLTITRGKVDDNAGGYFDRRYESKHCNVIVPLVKTSDNTIADTEAYQFCQLRLTPR